MMHITEDTPPDMLAGAMDLTVHLPNGRSVKMSVERSTPMMDVLVQITTAHHLQLSGHMINALAMAPSSEHGDKVLPYKPNTPIGTLDTQHIRVVPKGRSLPVPRNVPPGHQPFESTFRLKVHLPRNQLYVSRVSMNVHLGDIMRTVCDEKNLDATKYEFRHPANLDEVLDPKLSLSDYQITEIYVVSKGSSRLSQAFSASDIMALRKDEERKQSKSGGGVFNLIFKRGKTSNGSGSLSSDNRSISPTHSDDSRSVTPPGIQQQLAKPTSTPEKPKAPQRKRRPAPKPPQLKEEPKTTEKPAKPSEPQPKKTENGLTICHSRNSSDSSGYHEASILSDNANTSLPRRPQTMLITGEHSRSTSNLTSMSSQSKSTSSLAFTGRKKKAPPPPPVLSSASSVANLEKASPVVASPVEKPGKFFFTSSHADTNSEVERRSARKGTKFKLDRNFSIKKFKAFGSKLEDHTINEDEHNEEQLFQKFHSSMTRKWSKKFENSLEQEKARYKQQPEITRFAKFKDSMGFHKKPTLDTVERAREASIELPSPTGSYHSYKDSTLHSPESDEFAISAKKSISFSKDVKDDHEVGDGSFEIDIVDESPVHFEIGVKKEGFMKKMLSTDAIASNNEDVKSSSFFGKMRKSKSTTVGSSNKLEGDCDIKNTVKSTSKQSLFSGRLRKTKSATIETSDDKGLDQNIEVSSIRKNEIYIRRFRRSPFSRRKSDEFKSNEMKSDGLKRNELQCHELKSHELQNDDLKSDDWKSYKLESNELQGDELRRDDLKSDNLKSNELKSDEAKSDNLKSNDLQGDEFKSDELKSDGLKSNDLQGDELKSHELKSNELQSDDLKSNKLKMKELKSVDAEHSFFDKFRRSKSGNINNSNAKHTRTEESPVFEKRKTSNTKSKSLVRKSFDDKDDDLGSHIKNAESPVFEERRTSNNKRRSLFRKSFDDKDNDPGSPIKNADSVGKNKGKSFFRKNNNNKNNKQIESCDIISDTEDSVCEKGKARANKSKHFFWKNDGEMESDKNVECSKSPIKKSGIEHTSDCGKGKTPINKRKSLFKKSDEINNQVDSPVCNKSVLSKFGKSKSVGNITRDQQEAIDKEKTFLDKFKSTKSSEIKKYNIKSPQAKRFETIETENSSFENDMRLAIEESIKLQEEEELSRRWYEESNLNEYNYNLNSSHQMVDDNYASSSNLDETFFSCESLQHIDILDNNGKSNINSATMTSQSGIMDSVIEKKNISGDTSTQESKLFFKQKREAKNSVNGAGLSKSAINQVSDTKIKSFFGKKDTTNKSNLEENKSPLQKQPSFIRKMRGLKSSDMNVSITNESQDFSKQTNLVNQSPMDIRSSFIGKFRKSKSANIPVSVQNEDTDCSKINSEGHKSPVEKRDSFKWKFRKSKSTSMEASTQNETDCSKSSDLEEQKCPIENHPSFLVKMRKSNFPQHETRGISKPIDLEEQMPNRSIFLGKVNKSKSSNIEISTTHKSERVDDMNMSCKSGSLITSPTTLPLNMEVSTQNESRGTSKTINLEEKNSLSEKRTSVMGASKATNLEEKKSLSEKRSSVMGFERKYVFTPQNNSPKSCKSGSLTRTTTLLPSNIEVSIQNDSPKTLNVDKRTLEKRPSFLRKLRKSKSSNIEVSNNNKSEWADDIDMSYKSGSLTRTSTLSNIYKKSESTNELTSDGNEYNRISTVHTSSDLDAIEFYDDGEEYLNSLSLAKKDIKTKSPNRMKLLFKRNDDCEEYLNSPSLAKKDMKTKSPNRMKSLFKRKDTVNNRSFINNLRMTKSDKMDEINSTGKDANQLKELNNSKEKTCIFIDAKLRNVKGATVGSVEVGNFEQCLNQQKEENSEDKFTDTTIVKAKTATIYDTKLRKAKSVTMDSVEIKNTEHTVNQQKENNSKEKITKFFDSKLRKTKSVTIDSVEIKNTEHTANQQKEDNSKEKITKFFDRKLRKTKSVIMDSNITETEIISNQLKNKEGTSSLSFCKINTPNQQLEKSHKKQDTATTKNILVMKSESPLKQPNRAQLDDDNKKSTPKKLSLFRKGGGTTSFKLRKTKSAPIKTITEGDDDNSSVEIEFDQIESPVRKCSLSSTSVLDSPNKSITTDSKPSIFDSFRKRKDISKSFSQQHMACSKSNVSCASKSNENVCIVLGGSFRKKRTDKVNPTADKILTPVKKSMKNRFSKKVKDNNICKLHLSSKDKQNYLNKNISKNTSLDTFEAEISGDVFKVVNPIDTNVSNSQSENSGITRDQTRQSFIRRFSFGSLKKTDKSKDNKRKKDGTINKEDKTATNVRQEEINIDDRSSPSCKHIFLKDEPINIGNIEDNSKSSSKRIVRSLLKDDQKNRINKSCIINRESTQILDTPLKDNTKTLGNECFIITRSSKKIGLLNDDKQNERCTVDSRFNIEGKRLSESLMEDSVINLGNQRCIVDGRSKMDGKQINKSLMENKQINKAIVDSRSRSVDSQRRDSLLKDKQINFDNKAIVDSRSGSVSSQRRDSLLKDKQINFDNKAIVDSRSGSVSSQKRDSLLKDTQINFDNKAIVDSRSGSVSSQRRDSLLKDKQINFDNKAIVDGRSRLDGSQRRDSLLKDKQINVDNKAMVDSRSRSDGSQRRDSLLKDKQINFDNKAIVDSRSRSVSSQRRDSLLKDIPNLNLQICEVNEDQNRVTPSVIGADKRLNIYEMIESPNITYMRRNFSFETGIGESIRKVQPEVLPGLSKSVAAATQHKSNRAVGERLYNYQLETGGKKFVGGFDGRNKLHNQPDVNYKEEQSVVFDSQRLYKHKQVVDGKEKQCVVRFDGNTLYKNVDGQQGPQKVNNFQQDVNCKEGQRDSISIDDIAIIRCERPYKYQMNMDTKSYICSGDKNRKDVSVEGGILYDKINKDIKLNTSNSACKLTSEEQQKNTSNCTESIRNSDEFSVIGRKGNEGIDVRHQSSHNQRGLALEHFGETENIPYYDDRDQNVAPGDNTTSNSLLQKTFNMKMYAVEEDFSLGGEVDSPYIHKTQIKKLGIPVPSREYFFDPAACQKNAPKRLTDKHFSFLENTHRPKVKHKSKYCNESYGDLKIFDMYKEITNQVSTVQKQDVLVFSAERACQLVNDELEIGVKSRCTQLKQFHEKPKHGKLNKLLLGNFEHSTNSTDESKIYAQRMFKPNEHVQKNNPDQTQNIIGFKSPNNTTGFRGNKCSSTYNNDTYNTQQLEESNECSSRYNTDTYNTDTYNTQQLEESNGCFSSYNTNAYNTQQLEESNECSSRYNTDTYNPQYLEEINESSSRYNTDTCNTQQLEESNECSSRYNTDTYNAEHLEQSNECSSRCNTDTYKTQQLEKGNECSRRYNTDTYNTQQLEESNECSSRYNTDTYNAEHLKQSNKCSSRCNTDTYNTQHLEQSNECPRRYNTDTYNTEHLKNCTCNDDCPINCFKVYGNILDNNNLIFKSIHIHTDQSNLKEISNKNNSNPKNEQINSKLPIVKPGNYFKTNTKVIRTKKTGLINNTNNQSVEEDTNPMSGLPVIIFTETTEEIYIDTPSDEAMSWGSPEQQNSKKKLARTRNFPNRKFTKGENINWSQSESKTVFDKFRDKYGEKFPVINKLPLFQRESVVEVPQSGVDELPTVHSTDNINNLKRPVPLRRKKLMMESPVPPRDRETGLPATVDVENIIDYKNTKDNLVVDDKTNTNVESSGDSYSKALEFIEVDLFSIKKPAIPLISSCTDFKTTPIKDVTINTNVDIKSNNNRSKANIIARELEGIFSSNVEKNGNTNGNTNKNTNGNTNGNTNAYTTNVDLTDTDIKKNTAETAKRVLDVVRKRNSRFAESINEHVYEQHYDDSELNIIERELGDYESVNNTTKHESGIVMSNNALSKINAEDIKRNSTSTMPGHTLPTGLNNDRSKAGTIECELDEIKKSPVNKNKYYSDINRNNDRSIINIHEGTLNDISEKHLYKINKPTYTLEEEEQPTNKFLSDLLQVKDMQESFWTCNQTKNEDSNIRSKGCEEQSRREQIDVNEINVNNNDTNKIDANKIDANKIDANKIVANKIDANKIDENKIGADKMDANKIDANKIGVNKIGANKIDANKFDANKIDANKIDVNKINANDIEIKHRTEQNINEDIKGIPQTELIDFSKERIMENEICKPIINKNHLDFHEKGSCSQNHIHESTKNHDREKNINIYVNLEGNSLKDSQLSISGSYDNEFPKENTNKNLNEKDISSLNHRDKTMKSEVYNNQITKKNQMDLDAENVSSKKHSNDVHNKLITNPNSSKYSQLNMCGSYDNDFLKENTNKNLNEEDISSLNHRDKTMKSEVYNNQVTKKNQMDLDAENVSSKKHFNVVHNKLITNLNKTIKQSYWELNEEEICSQNQQVIVNSEDGKNYASIHLHSEENALNKNESCKLITSQNELTFNEISNTGVISNNDKNLDQSLSEKNNIKNKLLNETTTFKKDDQNIECPNIRAILDKKNSINVNDNNPNEKADDNQSAFSFLSQNNKQTCSKDFMNDFKELQNSSSDLSSNKAPVEIISSKPKNGFDTISRRRGFGIGKALLSIDSDSDITSITSDTVSMTSTNIYDSDDDIDDMSDVNVNIFHSKPRPTKTESASALDELLGMHNFHSPQLNKDQSANSLHNMDTIPGFLSNPSMRKWDNMHDLGIASQEAKWVVGDSDTESTTTPRLSEIPAQPYTTNSPPESIASSVATTLSSNIETDINPSKDNSDIVENEPMTPLKPLEPLSIETPKEPEMETDWHYQLPSPPTAFRDSSPPPIDTNYESVEEKFRADSVVTSPELFEKLKLVKETQSETSVVEIASVISEDKPIFNKLSLENLEKRKSLVYNRELATSFKYKDDDSVDTPQTESITSKRSSVLSELEEVISGSKASTLTRTVNKSENFIHSATDSSLPNFKITTYDMPKKNINIFEDDSVRSNQTEQPVSNLLKSHFGRSMENISLRKSSLEDGFKKPQEFNKFRSKSLARPMADVGRSESFSSNNWVPVNPVKRSKSQVAINQYKEERSRVEIVDCNLSKSNSLFDVSGLQSLEVMRLIQTKLNTPSNSVEQLDKREEKKSQDVVDTQVVQKPVQVEKPIAPKPYQYRGPPSINLGTWSERPKSQINLKEDTDYKFKSSAKLIASTNMPTETKSVVKSEFTSPVNVKVNGVDTKPNNVSIKVNGTEQITSQQSGNVIIKIGGSNKDFTSRYTPTFRKPLGNINKVDNTNRPRPVSVAYDSEYDISRVPIVRSVELKKPFKDLQMNTSITQIYPEINDYKESQSLNYAINNKHSQIYVNSETANRPIVRINSFSQQPVVKSFNQSNIDPKTWSTYKTLPAKVPPVQNDFTTNRNVPFSQCNLRRTDSNKATNTVNNNNIFGNVVLRNTSNTFNNNRYSTGSILSDSKTPPPPAMPKMMTTFAQTKKQPAADPRDELLSAIRNFGGKKGLNPVKV